MSDSTIFDAPVQGEAAPVANPVVTPQAPTIPPELVDLVGEGKKYKTVEAAIASLPFHTSHISKLEQELAELRNEVAARRTTQELVDELKSGLSTGASTSKQELSQDTLVKLVEQVITQKDSQKTAEINQSSVVNVFREQFGDKAEEHYNKVAAEAGLTIPMLNQLARTSPQAVIKLAGISKQPAPISGKLKSDVNPLALPATSGELSAKVAKMGSTKDVLAAWRIAGQKVNQKLSQS